MKQKVTLKVEMTNNEKSRSKAMKIASGSPGVRSVSIQGQQNDQLVVVGEDIDTVDLTLELRRKVGHTTILTVQGAPPPAAANDPTRRCTCEIPNSGFCEFCRSIYRRSPPRPPHLYYGVVRNSDPDACKVL